MIRPATVYQFAELLTKPYTQYDAYRKGLINESGKIVAKSGDLDGLEYIAMRVKSFITEMLPGSTKSFLSSLSGALRVFNEEFSQMGIDRSDVNVAIEKYLFEKYDGSVSYLDYLLEEAQSRIITEDVGAGMVSGGEGSLSTPSHSSIQGGIAGIDRPMHFLRRKPKKKKLSKKKKSRRILEQSMQMEKKPANPYMTIQVDPLDYEEIGMASTPSGAFDPAQIRTPELKKYLKRLSERSKVPVFIVGNAQQPPRMLNFNQTKKS